MTSLPNEGRLKTMTTERRLVMKILSLDLGKFKSVACMYDTTSGDTALRRRRRTES
jgi:hypothetical protein